MHKTNLFNVCMPSYLKIPFIPVFIPLSPCCVTGRSATLIWEDKTTPVPMDPPRVPGLDVPGGI